MHINFFTFGFFLVLIQMFYSFIKSITKNKLFKEMFNFIKMKEINISKIKINYII
jgi:hypothetical protein